MMTIDEAMKLAQDRANHSGARMAVLEVRHLGSVSGADWTDGTRIEYRVTKDRDDFPDEWIVVGYADPEKLDR